MCDPLTIAGIALTAGSVVANSISAGQQARARDSALAAERMRQNQYDQQAFALNEASRDHFVDYQPEQAGRATELGDYLSTSVAPDGNTVAASVMPSSESDIVNQERAKQTGEAQDFVDQQSGALGQLRAFGDLLGEKTRMQIRDAGEIAQIGGFKRGSSNVLPFELDEALKAGDGMAMLGDILSGAGSVTTGAGLSGGDNALKQLFGIKTPLAKAAGKAVSLVPGFGVLA